ncbi:MAG TPA: ADOP family duplicated permease [Vicinamibacterales bacterium]|nr:ADOP family duplicated permease [Vicinamibacterales bacterium]
MQEPPRPGLRHRLFRLMLRLLPAEFRGEFGRDMEADFGEQHRDAAQAGAPAVMGLWLRTLPSLVRLAFVERCRAFAADLHFALRLMARAPGFTVAAVATLAIGIGATTAVFSTVNATLLRPLPFPDSDRLVDVHTRALDGRMTTGLLSPLEITALGEAHDVVARAAGYLEQPAEVTVVRRDGTSVPLIATGVTDGFFDVLGLPMTLGRAFTHDEQTVVRGRTLPLLILSYGTWKTVLGGDPHIVGKTVRIAEGPADVTVVGVAAPEVALPRGTDVWFNVRADPRAINHNYGTILRLRQGATLDGLRSVGAIRMASLARVEPSDVDRAYVMRSLVSFMVGDLRPVLLIVLGATLLLLLLAAANVTNLLLARGTARSREIAVRTALGAGRGRVVRQMLTESLVLATAGTLAGLALAVGAVHGMLVLGASKLPRLQAVPFDGHVLLFAVAVLGVSAVAMGAAPAWRFARVDIRALLNESGRTTSASPSASRTMGSLVVAEIALAVALVAGAAWLVQSFARLRSTDPGFATNGRVVMTVRATRGFSHPADAHAWTDRMMEAVRSAAADSRVGAAATFPLLGDQDGTLYVRIQGQPDNPHAMKGARIRTSGVGFFRAMGTPLVAGRLFSETDRLDTERVAIVNRAFVRAFFPDGDPLNHAVTFGYPQIDPKTSSRIVGVVGDIRYRSLEQEAEPAVYLPLAQQPYPPLRQFVVVDASSGDPEALVAPLRAAMTRFDSQAIAAFEPAASVVGATLQRQELGMTLMLVFGATALVLGAIGIYGVIAYAVGQRRGEIATRMALGASRWDVFRLLIGSGERLGLAGLIVGVAIAYAGGRLVATSVFAMRASDPLVLAGALLAVAAVTLAAIAIPALRASRLDPAIALRSE